MQLRFHSREDLLAYVPGSVARFGQSPHYVGRVHVRGDKETASSFPATREPFCVPDDTPQKARWAKLCREGAIWPADPDTAAALGVAFVPVVFKDGAWVAGSGTRRTEEPKTK
jgi:hypothetical protein